MSHMDSSSALSPIAGSEVVRLQKLAENGKNWTLWREQINSAITERPKLGRHLGGCTLKPKAPTEKPNNPDAPDEKQIVPTETEMEEYEDKLDEWNQQEQAIKTILYSTLTETWKLKISTHSAHASWTLLQSNFHNLGTLQQADIPLQINKVCSAHGMDPCTATNTLERLQSDYAAAGGKLNNPTWQAIILASLPPSYCAMLCGVFAMQMVNAKNTSTSTTLTTEDIISIIWTSAGNNKTYKTKLECSAALVAHSGGQLGDRNL
jgi:muconolactone delta-isomerase